MILCDAGVLLCLVDCTQPQHQIYKNLGMRVSQPMVTTKYTKGNIQKEKLLTSVTHLKQIRDRLLTRLIPGKLSIYNVRIYKVTRPAAGFEPATFRLQVGCTTTVLCWRLVLAGRFFYSLTD